MGAGRIALGQALKQLIEAKQDQPVYISGSLGIYDSAGNQVIAVPSRPGFVYVRLRGQTSEQVEAFNETTAFNFGLPVIVTRDMITPKYYRVVGRDLQVYTEWSAPTAMANHAAQHSFGSGTAAGRDPVFIYKRQMAEPLLCHPNSPTNMTVVVEPDFYLWNGVFQYYAGGTSASLAGYLPSSGAAKYVTVYLDGNLNSIGIQDGTEFSIAIPPADKIPYIPEVDTTVGLPLSAVLLLSTTTNIDWPDMFDVRVMLGNGGGGSEIVNLPYIREQIFFGR